MSRPAQRPGLVAVMSDGTTKPFTAENFPPRPHEIAERDLADLERLLPTFIAPARGISAGPSAADAARVREILSNVRWRYSAAK